MSAEEKAKEYVKDKPENYFYRTGVDKIAIDGYVAGFNSHLALNEAAEQAYKTALARIDNGSDACAIKDILKHCAGEVVEAQTAYLVDMEKNCNYQSYAYELADIVICVLIAARRDYIDIEKAITEKMQINAKRAAGNGDKK